MIREHKKQFIYTLGMLTLSLVPVSAAHSYQKISEHTTRQTIQITEKVLADIRELSRISQETIKRMKEEEAARIAAELQAEEEAKPKPDELNMAHYFSEGADNSDPSQSNAAKVFDELTFLDKSWTGNVYHYMQKKPSAVAASLGIAADSRLHDLDSFEKIQLNVTDGDGKRISLYSNASAIMSLASVYTCYHNPDDYEEFMKYCKKLWEVSHSYTAGISDVYYCDGACVKEVEDEGEDWTEVLEEFYENDAEMSDVSTENGFDAALEDESDTATAADLATASDAFMNATPSDSESAGPGVPASCPGHVDLKIHMKIIGFDENHNLFEIDPIGNTTEDSENATLWTGWNEKTMGEARSLYEKDWYEAYGLTTSSIALGNPLSLSEIEATMRSLPQDLSETRKNVVRFALESVGKVPYYYGGKASRAGYEGNHFGSLVSEDQNGRILKGLDCSGWIGWVYWTAAGMEMPYATTFTLSSAGREIDLSELKPGDILVRTGKNAHVIMFLEWTEDGQIRCIHESSTAANNVIISVIKSSFPACRRLLND